jgi:hypothetical protein
MKATIEINEIKLKLEEAYMHDSYPKDGLYILDQYKKGINDQLVLVANKRVFVCGDWKTLEPLFPETKESTLESTLEVKEGVISESFALKMLAISNGNVNNVDLNDHL